MTPERWQQLKCVLQEALEIAPEQRPAFLERACLTDHSLRREVESLLSSSNDVRSSFLKSSPNADWRLGKGTRLGDFEILSLLGAGGMGEVYRARDHRLDREVALKVLPRFVSFDPERLRRFEQEAKAAAALNHPNILAVFHMGTYEGAPYLVSELLEGETLREQLKRGPTPPKKAVDYGMQIVQGLTAAHGKGIVHRDLKPENLFVTSDGRIKILDFGLAKLTHQESETQLTKETLDTKPGAVLGTVGYMAPEQVRGLVADHRSDIFAFGAILYEMLSGKRAFQKATTADTMSAILSDDPPSISHIVPPTALALRQVVLRCLEKAPEQRFQSASDLAFALEALSGSDRAANGALPAGERRFWKWMAAVGIVVVIAAVVLGRWLLYVRRARALTEKDTIVLADFTNTTGDPVFDGTLRQGLSVQLEQSPFLSLVPEQGIYETLRMMGQPTNARLTPEVAREVCQRTSSAATLEGSISLVGNQYNLILRAVNCASGGLLASAETQANDKNRVLDALAKVASEMRAKLGESISTLQKYNTPLEQATTSSLEALQAYSLGYKVWFSGNSGTGLAFFQRATELDPNFAMAYDAMSGTYQNINEIAKALQSEKKAFELRGGVSEREKLIIEGDYYEAVVGDLLKARQRYVLGAQIYPRDVAFQGYLGTVSNQLGQYETALKQHQEVLRLLPYEGIGYRFVTYTYLLLNRDEQAAAVAKEARSKGFDSGLASVLYGLAFYRNDAAEMARQVAAASGKEGQEDLLLALEADTAAYLGHLGRARELSRQAENAASRLGAKEASGVYEAVAALREGLFGNEAKARQQATAVKGDSDDRDLRFGVALAVAYAGANEARTLSDDFNKKFPEDTIAQFNYLPTLRARLALNHAKPRQALEALEAAAPYELGLPALGFYNWPNLYPIYVRGEAYLAAQQGNEAAVEFQKILDHRGIALNEPIGALAHLQLGRAYSLQGDKPKARAAYQDFLMLWKDADADIPLLKQAKTEYAKLQ